MLTGSSPSALLNHSTPLPLFFFFTPKPLVLHTDAFWTSRKSPEYFDKSKHQCGHSNTGRNETDLQEATGHLWSSLPVPASSGTSYIAASLDAALQMRQFYTETTLSMPCKILPLTYCILENTVMRCLTTQTIPAPPPNNYLRSARGSALWLSTQLTSGPWRSMLDGTSRPWREPFVGD